MAASSVTVGACTACRAVGSTRMRGTGQVEFLLWLLFGFGLFYSIYRRAGDCRICAACGDASVVDLTTPRGRELAEAQGYAVPSKKMQATSPGTWLVVWVLFLALVAAILAG